MKLIYSLMFILFFSHGFAQRNCGTMDQYATSIQNNSAIIQQRQVIESQIHTWIEQHPSNSTRTVLTIPVVVHVVYKTSAENISDSQIQSQLDVLNEDYSRSNADASQTPTAFQGVAANCEIQFCLAQRDPNNQPTNGITRTQTLASSFPIGASVKHASTGGKDAWPSDNYLNIWVCNLTSPVIGFATLPGTSSPDEDGVVIIYKHFGRTGTVEAPYNKGRTATHEIGHWLNLLHIWGDDENSGDNCAGSDQVSDTPNQAGPNFGCPGASTASCSNGGDMFMNYMDYTDDVCMNVFSTGQKNRMQATLNGVRSTIPISPACLPPPIIQSCDTLNNIVGGDGLVYYYSFEVDTNDTGFLTGTNSRNSLAYAEKHSVVNQHTIDAIRFDFAYAIDGTGSSNLHVGVWEDDGTNPPGSPGTLVGEGQMAISDIANNVDNFTFSDVVLSPSALVDGDFYVGFFTSDIAEDTIAVYSNQIDKVNTNTAWIKNFNGNWFEFNSDSTYGPTVALSLAIRPVACTTVGMEAVSTKNLLIYPNPSSAQLTVQFPNQSGIQSWQLFSVDGRAILNGRSTSSTLQIDTSIIPSGIYFFRSTDGKQGYSSKISVCH